MNQPLVSVNCSVCHKILETVTRYWVMGEAVVEVKPCRACAIRHTLDILLEEWVRLNQQRDLLETVRDVLVKIALADEPLMKPETKTPE